MLGPARGLPSSFCSLPGKSSNKAAQTQDTSSFQPCLTAALQARLWPEQLHSGPVWPDPLLQTSAGTHPAEEVVKAPVLEGFPQPRPACCQRSHPEIQPSVVSCCPAKLPGYLLAAPCPQATSAAGDLQRGCSGPLRPNSVSQHPLLSKENIKSVFFLFSPRRPALQNQAADTHPGRRLPSFGCQVKKHHPGANPVLQPKRTSFP